MYEKKAKNSVRDPYNINNRIVKFVFFIKNNNYNKHISISSHRGLIITYPNILTKYNTSISL